MPKLMRALRELVPSCNKVSIILPHPFMRNKYVMSSYNKIFVILPDPFHEEHIMSKERLSLDRIMDYTGRIRG